MHGPANAAQPPSEHATQKLLQSAQRWRDQASQALGWLGRTASLAQAGSQVGREVVDLVQGVHGSISSVSPPFGRHPEGQTRGITSLVYRCIGTGFDGMESAFATIARELPDDQPEPQQWLHIRSALNGVLGDRLETQANPLALCMQLCRDPDPSPRRVLFIHGLCMNELAWDNPAQEALRQALHRAGWACDRLRYNSGRSIAANGADLAELLASEHAAGRLQQLSLVGHSMGGLLIRSALAQAGKAPWTQAVKHCVYLGSPHQGAPLERIGNHANRLLGLSPYTAPFMRLGNIRSAGIQDLRHGSLRETDRAAERDATEDPRQPCPLHPGPQHLLLAATRSELLPVDLHQASDDYLVPVVSALGLDQRADWQLDAPRLRRQTLNATHHLGLLDSPRVSQIVQDTLLQS